MTTPQHTVFVYGTLRRGCGNHERYLADAPLVGNGYTVGEFTMVDCGHFPAVIPHGRTNIIGEVYRVDDAKLAALDRLEGVPHHYTREQVDVQLLSGETCTAWIYLQDDEHGRPVIETADWREYRRTADTCSDCGEVVRGRKYDGRCRDCYEDELYYDEAMLGDDAGPF